jgi:hypothetical protein
MLSYFSVHYFIHVKYEGKLLQMLPHLLFMTWHFQIDLNYLRFILRYWAFIWKKHIFTFKPTNYVCSKAGCSIQ